MSEITDDRTDVHTGPQPKALSGLDPNALYWSVTGEIACGRHAPSYQSDTWKWNRWTALPDTMAGDNGRVFACERCGRKA